MLWSYTYRGIYCALVVAVALISYTDNVSADSSASIDVSYVSTYYWRGFDILHNNSPAIQTAVSLVPIYNNISGILWMSHGIDRSAFSNFDEYDFTVYAQKKVTGLLTVEYGGTFLTFPSLPKGEKHWTLEFYSKLHMQSLGDPNITLYYDVYQATGAYIVGEISHPLNTVFPVLMYSSIAYNADFIIQDRGWSDWNAGITISQTFDKMYGSIRVQYSRVFLRSVNSSPEEIWIGATIGCIL